MVKLRNRLIMKLLKWLRRRYLLSPRRLSQLLEERRRLRDEIEQLKNEDWVGCRWDDGRCSFWVENKALKEKIVQLKAKAKGETNEL